MKQNERLLVYAVTGFLAVILVIAVWFGNDAAAGLRANPGADNAAQGVRDLGDLLGTDEPKVAPVAPSTDTPSSAGQVPPANGEQPLVSNGGALVAADLVAQQLGPSRRDYTVRWVTARAGDSLETLVVRWCGSRDFVEKAMRMNEDLRTVKIGQEVAVPWVDDEVVYEALEARQAKKLAGVSLDQRARPTIGGDNLGGDNLPISPAISNEPKAAPVTSRIGDLLQPKTNTQLNNAQPNNAQPNNAQPNNPASPNGGTFREPGKSTDGKPVEGGSPAPALTAQRYTVKSGDSLWAIAARVYGRKQADKMVAEIKRANPGATETLRPDQVLVLPPKQ